jgi:hypothetical protein
MNRIVVMIGLTTLVLSGMLAAQSGKSVAPVQGVWRLSETSSGSAPGKPVDAAEPGLYIFTKTHYSMVRVTAKRPDALPDFQKATGSEVAAVWSAFQANSGTYEIKGATLILHPTIAKDPRVMRASTALSLSFKVDGGQLVLTQGDAVTKWRRLE